MSLTIDDSRLTIHERSYMKNQPPPTQWKQNEKHKRICV